MSLFPENKFGFGMMRLPVFEDKSIDMEQVKHMVDAYLERGFNYFDTAYPYHSGASERAVKEVLVNRFPRESFLLADKLPAWVLKSQEDVQKIFDEQLERTGAGYFDFYLLHSVNSEHIPTYEKYDCWNWIQDMKAKGLVRHIGFSYHDIPETLDKLLTEHPEVEFVQLQLNYLDWENNLVQAHGNYEVCVKHNKPVIVMEPVKGGTLASMQEDAADLLKAFRPDASLASWALRFCASLDNVKMVLSGMSTEEQMLDNLNTMKCFEPLSEKEKEVIQKVADTLLSADTVPCTGCRYCVDGCPMNIQIPDLIRCLNNVKLYGFNMRAYNTYNQYTAEDNKASVCIQCGQCEAACPQRIKVITALEEAAAQLEREPVHH